VAVLSDRETSLLLVVAHIFGIVIKVRKASNSDCRTKQKQAKGSHSNANEIDQAVSFLMAGAMKAGGRFCLKRERCKI
jgi:hypothetical protein